MEQRRLTWVDTAKGWGILAIVVSHVFTGHPVSRWLYSFHVPLFFFLSGYLFKVDRSWGEFWRGKVKKLLIPYFALALPIVPAEAALYGGREWFWEETLEMGLGMLLQRRMWPIWFLACLFVLEIIAYPLFQRLKRPWHLGFAAALCGAAAVAYTQAGLPALPWNLDACFGEMPFFAAGYLLKNSKPASGWLEAGKGRILTFFLLAFGNVLFALPAVRGRVPGMDVFQCQYGIPWLSFPAAFCGIGAVLLASQYLTASPIRYLGKNSLLYFVWHQTPVITAIYYFFPKWGIAMENYPSALAMLGEKGLELAIILLVITVCNELLARSGFRWVLGK